MKKKDKLYTVNRFNRPAFVDRTNQNVFDGFGQTSLLNPNINPSEFWSRLGVNTQLNNPLGQAGNAAAAQTMANFAPASNAVTNPFSFKEAFSSAGLKSGLKAGAGAAISAGAGLIGGLANNAISGGLESGAGSTISGLGSTVGGAVGAVNPIAGAVVNVGSQLIGGLVNRAFGMKTNQEALNKANAGTSALSNFVSNADSFDDIQELQSVGNVGKVYKGGWFSGGKAKRKNEELKQQRMLAHQFATRSIENNVNNLVDDQMNNALANFSAFGGPLDMGGGALDYGLAMDYLTMKKQQNEAKNRVPGISPMPAINTFGHGGCFNPFALGGDVQMHGADFTNGLIVPSDNTRVFKPMMLPVQRQQNFSDSEYFWDAGKEYPAGLWKHKDGTFHTTGSYGKDIVLTQEEADSIIRANKAKNRREKLRKAMENHKQNTYANGGQMYSIGQTYDVSEEEANRLKATGYEFTVVS